MSLNDTDKALCKAAKGGNATTIQRLEKEGANVNCKDPSWVSELGSEGGRECAGAAGNTAKSVADKHMLFTPNCDATLFITLIHFW